ncbi:uncharacterized protein F4817DRAFT_318683 [Daldinia loculata]|uniref:uncharacterized protein n=1 Tax=Daldinia loculata TaxID=103429 RepID=UPI0020C1C2B7|nr:uncharacterized protein F4817DRAFT_318683 [Daldinia loculata]KAI1644525.1 hypothetical protein F4817DRAFT_318683 [Daldinia loculata]
MGIFSFINTGMQSIASWWSDRQAVKSTDACLWFVLGAVVGFVMRPEQKPRRRLPFPGTLLKEEAFEDRSSYDKAVAKADHEWAKFSKTMRDIEKKAKKLEKAKAKAEKEKKQDEEMDKVLHKAKLLYGNDTTSEQQELGRARTM